MKYVYKGLIAFFVLYVGLMIVTNVMQTGMYEVLDGETTAILLSHEDIKTRTKVGYNTSYCYTYKYYVDGVEYVETSTYISEHMHDGDEVTIHYDTVDPSISMLYNENTEADATLFAMLIIAAGIGGVCIYYSKRG